MILVTGSTGLIGSEILRLLSHAGVPARALVRNPRRGQALPGITWVKGDLAKPETLGSVFAGCTKLFLLTGNVEDASELQRHAIAAARHAGVAHVVKLSAFGASAHSHSMIGRMHHQIEKELQESGVPWTILRPHHFMQNLLSQADNLINDGVVYSSSGDGKIPFVDTRDIAAGAVVTLTEPGHTGKKYVITGGEALSYRQATDILGEAIGRSLRFIDEPVEEARVRSDRDDHQRCCRSDRHTTAHLHGVRPRLCCRVSAAGRATRSGLIVVQPWRQQPQGDGCTRVPRPEEDGRRLSSSSPFRQRRAVERPRGAQTRARLDPFNGRRHVPDLRRSSPARVRGRGAPPAASERSAPAPSPSGSS